MIKPPSNLRNRSSRAQGFALAAAVLLALVACGGGTDKEVNGKLDGGQVEQVSLADLQKLAADHGAFPQFVLNKWKVLYNEKVFGNNADPTELAQLCFQVESAANSGVQEAGAFLPQAQAYLKHLNVQTGKAKPVPPLFTGGGPLVVESLVVRPANDVQNPFYLYRRISGVVLNPSAQPVPGAAFNLYCFDAAGKRLGDYRLQVHDVAAGGQVEVSEDVPDGTCAVKVAGASY
jgi:hypothetical protein